MKRMSIYAACLGFFIFQCFAGGTAEAGMQRRMEITLQKAKKRVEDALLNIDKNMTAASKKLTGLDIKSGEARKILSKLSGTNKYSIDCAIVDMEGKMAVVEPEEYRKFEGTDIKGQKHIQDALSTKKPGLGKLFLSVEGVSAVDLEYPIISSTGEMKGVLSMILNPGQMLGALFYNLLRQNGYSICVMQEDGVFIYDPDSEQIQKNVFTDGAYKPFPSLTALFRQVAEKEKGSGTYEFYANGLRDKRVIKKAAIWDSVSLNGTSWRIVVFAEEWLIV